jgi:hypothetical protein
MENNLLTKSELAAKILTEMFANSRRISIADAVEAADKVGVSRKTLTTVRKNMGAVEIHNGPHPGFWQIVSTNDDE